MIGQGKEPSHLRKGNREELVVVLYKVHLDVLLDVVLQLVPVLAVGRGKAHHLQRREKETKKKDSALSCPHHFQKERGARE